MQIHNLFNRMK